MRAIVLGMGEIGQAICKVFEPYHDIDCYDIRHGQPPEGTYDVMLACFPYNDDFITYVKGYQKGYKPKATIIFSTVSIGTTSQIEGAVHSPVEGRHPNLADSIRLMPRWVGGINDIAERFFLDAKMNTITCPKPEITEFLKLRSTSRYGVNIEFARYEKSVCDALDMPYSYVKAFDMDYNALYEELGILWAKRYILDPPRGNIGGHCVVPNAKLLDEQYPSWFLKEIYYDKEKGVR